MSRDRTRLIRPLMFSTAEACRPAGWCPPADVYQIDRGWLIKFDLAGVSPDEIQVSVGGRRLTVSGTRRDWSSEECQHSYSMEISYNRFERSIELPGDLEGACVSTEYRDGMLLVRLRTEAANE